MKEKNLIFNDTGKVILIDFGLFVHQSIFASVKLGMHAPYLCVASIFACLEKIEINPDDLLIIAVDSQKGNWRKQLDNNYKANRQAAREKSNIDWPKKYAEFTYMLNKLEQSTPFHVIELDKLEADDIIAYTVRFFNDRECIIISTDSDFEQLCQYKNVRILSPKTKTYKIVKDPEKVLGKKITREQTDNLITPILSKADYERRRTLVNLSKLPDDVEELIESKLHFLVPKTNYNVNLFPYMKMSHKVVNIYDNADKKLAKHGSKTKKVAYKQNTLEL